jgi:hypothetical protein
MVRMTGPEELTPRQRRVIVARTLIRTTLSATLLVVLYYVLPMNRAIDTRTGLLLGLLLLALGAILALRTRGIVQSDRPGLRAIETLGLVVPLYILAFATTYYLNARANSTSFSEPLTRSDALYFSMTIFSTVGFGDIAAKTEAMRLVVTVQMFFDLILLGFGARAFISAVNLGRKRQGRQTRG